MTFHSDHLYVLCITIVKIEMFLTREAMAVYEAPPKSILNQPINTPRTKLLEKKILRHNSFILLPGAVTTVVDGITDNGGWVERGNHSASFTPPL